jgi:hypothetical protein
MRKTIILAMFLACGTAQASNWISVGKTNDGKSESFIDLQSVRIDGDIRRAWVKTVYASRSNPGPFGKYWASTVARTSFNCSEETRRWDALTIYFDDESLRSIPASQYPTAWEPVTPDTIESANMAFICAWKPK